MTSIELPKRPGSYEELGAAVRAASEAGRQVRVVGSGAMGEAMLRFGREVQSVSIGKLNKVVEHAVTDMTVIVQAGMTLEALQRELAWRNQWLPVDAPGVGGKPPGSRTIGGMIATNSLGPLRFGLGDWRFLMMGMRWIDARGILIKGGGRTVKNVAGYSTPRMMIDSCGSLGVIAEVTLRTFARPADERCVVVYCEDAQQAERLLAEIMTSETTPMYVEAVGARTFAGNPLGLPGGGDAGGVMVIVGFMGPEEIGAGQVEVLREMAGRIGLEAISQGAAPAGRLRLWITSEPAMEAGIPFRIYGLSSQAAGLVAAIERSGEAWVVSEAGNGVVRGVAKKAEDIKRIAKEAAAACQIIGEPTKREDPIYDRVKPALDPTRVFGDV